MAALKDEAIVLRVRRFSESSLVATLLGRSHGRLDVLAKGARRDKSPLFGHLDLYQREAVLVLERPAAGLDLLTEAAFVDECAGLRFHPPAFAAAGVLAEMTVQAALPGEPLPEVYDALARSLAALADLGDAPARAGLAAPSPFSPAEKEVLLVRIVTLALLDMLRWLGFGLELRRCVRCGGTPAEGEAVFLSKRHGGLVCRACRAPAGPAVPITAAALQSLRERDGTAPAGGRPLPAGESVRWLAFLLDYCQHAIEKPLRGKGVLARMLTGKG